MLDRAIANQVYFPGMNSVSVIRTAFGGIIGLQDPIDSFDPGWNGGLYFSTRDLAQIGYLVLRDGNWNGTQLSPASFVSDLYTNQISPSATISPDTSNSETMNFPLRLKWAAATPLGFGFLETVRTNLDLPQLNPLLCGDLMPQRSIFLGQRI